MQEAKKKKMSVRAREWVAEHCVASSVFLGVFLACGLLAVLYFTVFSNLSGNSADFIYSQF